MPALVRRAAAVRDRATWMRVAYRLRGRARVRRAIGILAAPLALLRRRARR